MSKKRPVAYIKPQDPSFLVKLKKEAGYKEGPTVETKREIRGLDSGSDDEHDLQPQVVVLGKGDLSAEEVNKIKKDQEKAEANVKADLTKPIVFHRPETSKRSIDSSKKPDKKKQSKKVKLLSFDEDDD